MARPTILVTGAGGQLGSELRELEKKYTTYQFIFTDSARLPIEKKAEVDDFFLTHHPSYCINCAAYTAVDKAEQEIDKAFLVNGTAPGILAAACKRTGTRLIHISTDYVFDGNSSKPYKENDATAPFNVYGRSKLQGEIAVIENDPGAVIIRTSWVYSQYGRNFVKTMLKLMQEKEELRVVNDQYGSPTYAADLAETIMTVISSARFTPGIFHYCNSGITSWYEFAKAIGEISGTNCRVTGIPTVEYPTPARRPAYSALDTQKIQSVYGINPPFWKDSLQSCLKKIGFN
jgi:dTDP-4-dehydrorhamnose reductase